MNAEESITALLPTTAVDVCPAEMSAPEKQGQNLGECDPAIGHADQDLPGGFQFARPPARPKPAGFGAGE